MAQKFTPRWANQSRQAFDFYDTAKKGTISVKDIAPILRASGSAPTNRESRDSMNKLLKAHTRIKKADFVEFVRGRILAEPTPEQIIEAFKEFDPDGKY